ncbi:MAG: PEGA domain-containing protein [Acidobacteriota bacterium]
MTSSPSPAEVLVNGTRRGVTPRILGNLPLGTYTVRVSRQGYSPQEAVVTLSPDRLSTRVTFSLSRLRQEPTPAAPPPRRPAARTPAARARGAGAAPKTPATALGSISVETRPGGVRVFIDGRAVGLSPLVVPEVAAGKHEVRLELQGYRPWVTTVTLTPGQRLRVTASLERAPSR